MSFDNPRPNPQDAVASTNKEQQKKIFEVQLGESFPLFPIEATNIRTREGKCSEFDSTITLVVPNGELLKFATELYEYEGDPEIIFAPFRPKTGYHIDGFDLDEVAGTYKYEQWLREFDPSNSDPLSFFLTHDDEDEEQGPVSEITYRLLDTLQLQIVANGLTLQADQERETSIIDVPVPKISFHNFYPMDTGPLRYLPNNGLKLRLPSDLETLRTIQAKFVLPNVPVSALV